jgi:hypothetical protein
MRRSNYVEFNKIRFSLLWFFCDLLWFFKGLVKIKIKKKKRKTAVTSSSNCSERLCERFCESEESEWTVLLFREEKQIRVKVEGYKRTFSIIDWLHTARQNSKMGCASFQLDQTYIWAGLETICVNWTHDVFFLVPQDVCAYISY